MRNKSSCRLNGEEICSGSITQAIEPSDDIIYHKVIATVPLWYHTMVCVILTSLAINGIILNGLVLRHFWIRRKVQKPYNLLLVNLTFVELLLAFNTIVKTLAVLHFDISGDSSLIWSVSDVLNPESPHGLIYILNHVCIHIEALGNCSFEIKVCML